MLLALSAAAAPSTQPTVAPAVPSPVPVAADDAAAPPMFEPYAFVAAAAAKQERDPIGPLAARMGTVTSELGDGQTDAPVQDQQRAVVTGLDAVIKQLEQQCKGGGGGNPNPTKPMARSQITQGPGGSGPLHDATAGTRTWGSLRPGDRDQITQSQTEGFPPGYEQVLAGYYSRLSQEQVAGDASGGATPAGPTTQPTDR